MFCEKGSSIKDVRSQGGGGFVQCGHFADKGGRGFFRCGRPHFLAQKNSNFSKFMLCPHGKGGVVQCGQGGRGSIFRVFVRTSFMDGPK